jgi:hypothetical protein
MLGKQTKGLQDSKFDRLLKDAFAILVANTILTACKLLLKVMAQKYYFTSH